MPVIGVKPDVYWVGVNDRKTDYIIPSLWTRLGVVMGVPTYEAGLFPPVAHML